ncbi:MAG: prepilin-type N-terminal cleavage/methylation domain-containing protein [Opitutaceae bacterium]|jgi:prepilin-type N-terminal cleavage/methylation domain-containing protein|nr:prepilin-type N-terminal cleavage/methylation domain-containing protein [Opitutaceae bacterium]
MKTNHAFTLVELLTVIAIIGILAAIIIPTAGKVRETAKKAACASNVRQTGMALLLFADENKGFGPRGNAISKISVGGAYYNFGELLPYLGFARPANGNDLKIIPPVLRCPGANPQKIASLMQWSAAGDCTYYMNNDTGADAQGNEPCGISINNKNVGESARLADLPPRRIAIIDYNAWWIAGGQSTGVPHANHNGTGANVFRLNGSVQWLANATMVSAANGTGWLFHKLDDAR